MKMKMKMKTICAWCGKLLRDGHGPVSHGICETCAKKVMEES
jgi:hypothetical protein